MLVSLRSFQRRSSRAARKKKSEQARIGYGARVLEKRSIVLGSGDSRVTFLVPRATCLARTLLDVLRGEAGARKKICDGRGHSATPGFPVSVRRRKSRRRCAPRRCRAIPACRRFCNERT